MTLLSLFITSTGVFCFVPISQGLVKSGIIPTSNSRPFRRLPSILAPTFYAKEDSKLRFLLTVNKFDDARFTAGVPLCSAEDSLSGDRKLIIPCTNKYTSDTALPLDRSPSSSSMLSTPIDTSGGADSYTSFVGESTLCDSCNILLRREIPPDHIPSVIRALALFEAQGRLPDAVFSDHDVATLTNAFSMLQL